jgi:lysophospholipase L1-like esterase
LLVALLAAGVSDARAADAGKWVGTWSASPQPAMPGAVTNFSGQSVRLIVHTSIGGTKVRIRISNTYGTQPLIIGAAHVARAGSGAETRAGTDRVLYFGGRPSVTIAPRQTVTSDTSTLDVPALSNLAVSLYFPKDAPATTAHHLALQTNYTTAGDVTAVDSLPDARKIDSWPFLTGVDVLAPDNAGTIVLFGDSTVDGDGSTADTNRRWSDQFAARLQRIASGKAFGVLNQGIIGNRLLSGSPADPKGPFGAAFGEAGTARFARDVLGQSGVTHVIVRIGINDIGFPGSFDAGAKPVTPEAMIEGFRALVAQAHAKNIRIIATTLTPFSGTQADKNYFSPEKEGVRKKVNQWLRTTKEFDGLVDLDATLRDPAHVTQFLPEFDSGDHLHPSNAGYAASAAAVDMTLLTGK